MHIYGKQCDFMQKLLKTIKFCNSLWCYLWSLLSLFILSTFHNHLDHRVHKSTHTPMVGWIWSLLLSTTSSLKPTTAIVVKRMKKGKHIITSSHYFAIITIFIIIIPDYQIRSTSHSHFKSGKYFFVRWNCYWSNLFYSWELLLNLFNIYNDRICLKAPFPLWCRDSNIQIQVYCDTGTLHLKENNICYFTVYKSFF